MSTSLQARIAQIANDGGVQVSATELEQLVSYCKLLHHWNATINLTALPLDDFPDATLQKLITEPLAIASLIENRDTVWLDLGSGGGSPAIPLKILKSSLRLTMVEARERKSAFLREVVRDLGLMNTHVLTARFESLVEQPPAAELVTVRAVKPDRAFFEVVASLLAPSGRLAVFARSDAPAGDPLKLVSSTPLPSSASAVHWFAKP